MKIALSMIAASLVAATPAIAQTEDQPVEKQAQTAPNTSTSSSAAVAEKFGRVIEQMRQHQTSLTAEDAERVKKQILIEDIKATAARMGVAISAYIDAKTESNDVATKNDAAMRQRMRDIFEAHSKNPI